MKCLVIVLLAAAGLSGCSSRTFTNTPRAAIEQLLLSGAVDSALEKFELPQLKGQKVYVDVTNLKAYDVEYIRVAARARICRIGGVLVEKAEEADYTVELASGALGTEYKTGVVGMPSIPVPNSSVPMPEVPLYRKTEQTGIFKLLIFVHARGRFIAANWYYAKCDRDESFFMFKRYQRRDDVRVRWEKTEAEQKPPAEKK